MKIALWTVAIIVALVAVVGVGSSIDARFAKLEHRVEVAEARATLAFRAVGQCVTDKEFEPYGGVLGTLANHNGRIRAFERAYPLNTR